MNSRSYSNVERETFDPFVSHLAHLPVKFNREYISSLDTQKTMGHFPDIRIARVYDKALLKPGVHGAPGKMNDKLNIFGQLLTLRNEEKKETLNIRKINGVVTILDIYLQLINIF